MDGLGLGGLGTTRMLGTAGMPSIQEVEGKRAS